MFDLVYRLPRWLRPTYRGALFIFGIGIGPAGKAFVLTLLAIFVLMGGVAQGLILFFRLLGVAVVSGGAAGTIHGALHWMDDWGGIGIWLRWALTNFGNVVVFGVLTPAWPFSPRDPALYVLAAAIAVVAATCLMLTDDRRPSRLTPRRFSQLQLRELMWENADRARDTRPHPPAQEGDPARAESGERASAREQVREEWIETIRRSRSMLNWWTRE